MMTVFVREEDSKRRIVLRNGVSLRYQKMGKMHGCTKSKLLHHRCNGFFLNDSELSVCCTGGSMVRINSVHSRKYRHACEIKYNQGECEIIEV